MGVAVTGPTARGTPNPSNAAGTGNVANAAALDPGDDR